MTPSKTLFYFCISFIVGVFASSAIKIPQIFLWAFLFSGIFLIFISFLLLIRSQIQTQRFMVAGFCLLFAVLGISRHQISEFNVQNSELIKFNDAGEVVLTGRVAGEPDRRDTFQKIKIKAEKIIINNKTSEKQSKKSKNVSAEFFTIVKNSAETSNLNINSNIIKGTVLVIANRYPEYGYSDRMEITGKLETPAMINDFNYKNYLLKDGIYSVMNFPKVELIKDRGPTPILYSAGRQIYSKILFAKQKLRESIRRNFSPPQSLILEGTVLGDSGALTQDMKEKLNITGLRHIIAVSGTHVVILGSIIMSLALVLGFWRGQAFYIAIVFICFYIVLTGLPASGVRAGIMGGFFLLAQKLGRQAAGSRVMALACAAMLLINPLLLFYDIGFQLSFLAVLGLIHFEPPIKNFLKLIRQKIDDRRFFGAIDIASTTIAAQIFTLPVMIYNFGNVSFVSIITNVLILPVVYWLMVFGFLSSALGAVFQPLGQIISAPCWFLLTYFIKVMDFFSQPWLAKTVEGVSWVWLAVYYPATALLIRFLNRSKRMKFPGY